MTDRTTQAADDARAGPLAWGWPQWTVVVLAAATALGVITVMGNRYAYASFGGEMPLGTLARIWLPDYYLWAALAPLILWLGRRFPVDRGDWIPHLGLHLVAGALFSATELLASCLVVSNLVEFLPPERLDGLWAWYLEVLARYFVWGILIYLMILAAGHAWTFYRRLRERELEAAELQRELARAQLQALKMQIHPHFLFNTLHSIGVLVRKGAVESALGMLAGLGDLLRYSLDTADRQEVPLKEEIEFLERYLEVEQIRFRDRLDVEVDVEPEVLDARVPNLILQPLVENAVKHGVAPQSAACTVRIAARRDGGRLLLEVRDDGRRTPPGWSAGRDGDGVGVPNVRQRLRALYGSDADLVLEALEPRGVAARITLPYRGAGPADDREAASPSGPVAAESRDRTARARLEEAR